MPTRRSRMAQGSRLCAGPPQPHPQPWESILSPILIARMDFWMRWSPVRCQVGEARGGSGSGWPVRDLLNQSHPSCEGIFCTWPDKT